MKTPEDVQARMRQIRADFMEEFYQRHPEKRPAQVETRQTVNDTVMIRSPGEVEDFARALEQTVAEVGPVEIKIAGVI